MGRLGFSREDTGRADAPQNERLVTAIFERAEPTNAEPARDEDVVPAAQPGARPPDGGDEPEVQPPRGPFDTFMVVCSYIRYAVEWALRPGLRRRNRLARDELWARRRTKKIYAFLNSKGASGKTAGSTTSGLLFADAINRDCVVVDMNDSPGGSASNVAPRCSCRSICAATAAASSRPRRASPTTWSGRASPASS
jgi:hypothetical protein